MTTAIDGSPTIPKMVTHQPKDGYCQKEVYSRLGIWHLDLTHKTNTRFNCHRWPILSLGWSHTNSKMVTHHTKYVQQQAQFFKGWSPTFQWLVTHLPKEGHPPSQGWSITIPRIWCCSQDGHPPTVGWPPTIPRWAFTFLRTVNQTWSLTLAQPRLSSLFLKKSYWF